MIFNFAWRYFIGKKSTQAIQIISWVSVVAMAAGTAALLIVLSVFNGFELFIKDLYSNFYPELKIYPAVGKTFIPTEKYLSNIRGVKGIKAVSKTLDEKVLFIYNQAQVIATIKGIDSDYENVTGIAKNVKYGRMDFSIANSIPPIVLGIGVSNRLGASEETHLPITCYAFKKGVSNLLDMASAYSSVSLEVTGVYVLQEEIDNQFVYAPLQVVEELIGKPQHISALELAVMPNANEQNIIDEIKKMPDSKGLTIETRFEQNKTLYFILKSERWAVYSILTLMLIIASFNIVGSLSMLILDKDKDIAILKTMGMQTNKIRKIFLSTGILLALVGTFIGCILALIICLIQQHYGIIKLGGSGSFLLEAYPVKLKMIDFILVFITVIIIAFLASLLPSIKASKKEIELRVK